MKLSQKTIEIFKYFSTLSPSILVREGNVLRTRNVSKTISTKAELTESFPKEFTLYSIPEFLKTINLFTEPDIEFLDTHMMIEEGALKVRYMYTPPELYQNAPENKDYVPTNVNWTMKLTLTEQELNNIQKSSNVLNLNTVSFTEEGILVFSDKNKDANNFKMAYQSKPELKDVSGKIPKKFSINFPSINFNLFTGEYVAEFSCSNRTSVKLTNIQDAVTIWVAASPSSSV